MNLIERWKAQSSSISIKIQNIAVVVAVIGTTVSGLPEIVNQFFPNFIDLGIVVKIGGIISGIAGFVTALIAKLSSVALPEQTK